MRKTAISQHIQYASKIRPSLQATQYWHITSLTNSLEDVNHAEI